MTRPDYEPTPQIYAPKPTASQNYPPAMESTQENFTEMKYGPNHPRYMTRTPSPTPSEAEALSGKTRTCSINFTKYLNKEWLKQPKNILTLVGVVVLVGLLITFVALQDKIIKAIEPLSYWLKTTPGAWLIPIGIMIVMSFPPLFGHEIVAILCGIVWGVWIGFAIVAAGTVIGELCTYILFRYGCKGRAKKSEQKSLQYALLSAVIREGGLKMAIMMRLSVIPGHLSTAVFASAGQSIQTFLIAAIIALPKQLSTVYLGYAENTGATENGSASSKSSKSTKIIKFAIIIATLVVTFVAMRYVNAKIDRVKARVIYERRKARQQQSVVALPDGTGLQGSNARNASDEDLEVQAMTPLVMQNKFDSEATLYTPEVRRQARPTALAQSRLYPAER